MVQSYLSFEKESPEVQELVRWWHGLDYDRGERAALRRCQATTEIIFSPSYHRLRLALIDLGRVNDDQLSLVVGLSAQVKVNGNDATIAEQMATGRPGGSARVSGLRFRRLLKVKDREELFTAMSRVIRLLGGTVNLQSLAQSLYGWNEETRRRWAFDYYSNAPDQK